MYSRKEVLLMIWALFQLKNMPCDVELETIIQLWIN